MDQANFMRIRVDFQLEWIASVEGLGMKGSQPFVFSVGGWVVMRNIVKSPQTSRIPSNTANGSELKETQRWDWKNQGQPVVETEKKVVRIGLKKIM